MQPRDEEKTLEELESELALTNELITQLETRIATLPHNDIGSIMRETMEELLGQMRRMEENSHRLMRLRQKTDPKEDGKMAIIDNLKMSEEALEQAIQTFETKKLALENSYLKISNEVRTLDGTYHGEASEKFKAQFDALYKNLQQNETVMSNVVSNLKTALGIYQEHEQQARSMMEGLDVGTSYQSNL